MKTWEKPKLIILVRTRPEESLLQACKDHSPDGPTGVYALCSTDCANWCSSSSGS
jgi:hypothetical protein